MENPLKLNDKTVLLTGGTTALGFSIASALSELGANIAIVDKNEDKANRLANQINDQREVKSSRGRGAAIIADLSKPHHARDAVTRVAEAFGGIDIYIDALILSRNLSFESEEYFQEFDRMVDVNLKAPLYLSAESIKFMRGKKRGRIIFLIPDLARIGFAGDSLVSSTRMALVGFSRSLAREVSKDGVTVNCLAIGPTEDYLLARDPKAASIHQAQQDLVKLIPQAKLTSTDDVVGSVVYLASSLSSGVTGQTLVSSGGLSMST